MSVLPRRDPTVVCCHKESIGCWLTAARSCCACMDSRAFLDGYTMYVDGAGTLNSGSRWMNYCGACKVFWNRRFPGQRNYSSQPLDPQEPVPISQEIQASEQIPQSPTATDTLQNSALRDGTNTTDLTTDSQPLSTSQIHQTSRAELIQTASKNIEEIRERIPKVIDALRALRIEPSIQFDDTLYGGVLEILKRIAEPTNQSNSEPSSNTMSTTITATAGNANPRPPFSTPADSEHIPVSQATTNPGQNASGSTNSPSQRRRRNRNQERTENRMRQAFGTREDIESEDYQSPLDVMFGRAMERYRVAEAQRNRDHSENEAPDSSRSNASAPQPQPLPDWSSNGSTPHWVYARQIPNPLQSPAQPQVEAVNVMAPSESNLRRRTGHFGRRRQANHTNNASYSLLNGHGPLSSNSPSTTGATDMSINSLSEDVAAIERMYYDLIGRELGEPDPAQQPQSGLDHEDINTLMEALRESHAPPAMPRFRFGSGRSGRVALPVLTAATSSGSNSHAHPPIRYVPATAVEVNEPTFDTQERPPPLTDEELSRSMACKVCMEQIIDTVLVPCGHAALCHWCADIAIPCYKHDASTPARRSNCPVCRKGVRHRYKMFL